MDMPVEKNRKWIASLHESIDQLGEDLKAEIMKPAGEGCASDLLKLCEEHLGREVVTVEDLVEGWNTLRERRGLNGKWEIDGSTVRAIFGECGCRLVRSGMIALHPIQCYCSQGLMEAAFGKVAKHPVTAGIVRAIGWGDSVCEFVITTNLSTDDDT